MPGIIPDYFNRIGFDETMGVTKMIDDLDFYEAAIKFVNELANARSKFGPMLSAHEGYAVIKEELDELWEIVKQKQSKRNYDELRKETIQLGAMVLAFLVEIVETENRR